jgi:hypothetical protein
VQNLEDVLARSGSLLAAWDRSGDTVVIYAGSDLLHQVWHGEVAVGERPAFYGRLRRRGVRIGATDGISPYVWSDDGGFTVWSHEGMIADGRDGVLEAGGAQVRQADVRRVVSFLDPHEWSHRGVRVELHDGFWHTIAYEDDSMARFDPTYGVDNLIMDAAWASYLGRDLARWFGVPHVDELP